MDQRKLEFIQYLRGIAAFMVLVSHVLIQKAIMSGHGDAPATLRSVVDGEFGVFIFFIISGFIMIHIGGGDFGAPNRAFQFLLRRFLRIAPMYWICTALMIALLYAKSGAIVDLDILKKIASSLLFIPYDFHDGKFRPILMVGWTLDYEMFFYVIFGLALCLPRALGLAALMLIFTLLALAGAAFVHTGALAQAWTRPIILLFLAGCVMALAWQRWRAVWPSLSPQVGMILVAGLIALQGVLYLGGVGWTTSALDWRPIHWIIAGAIVFVGLAATGGDGPVWRGLKALGDSSYSLYLTHPLVISVASGVWKRLPLHLSDWIFVAVLIPASVLFGWFAYRLVELPVHNVARRLTPAAAA